MNKVRYEDVEEGYVEIDGDEVVFVHPAKSRRTAEIVPFPISRQCARMATMRQRAADFPKREQEWLAEQIDKHVERLTALRVDEAIINREVDDMVVMLGLMPPKEELAHA